MRGKSEDLWQICSDERCSCRAATRVGGQKSLAVRLERSTFMRGYKPRSANEEMT